MLISPDRKILLGSTTTSQTVNGQQPKLQIVDPTTANSGSAFIRTTNNGGANIFIGCGGPGSTPASGVSLGEIRFGAYDTSVEYRSGASINAFVDGTIGTGDVPAGFRLNVQPQASGITPAITVTSDGTFLMGKTTDLANVTGTRIRINGSQDWTSSADTNIPFFNRIDTDGAVLLFRRQVITVGSIAVTESSTSYNTTSDYRLKENLNPLENASERLKQIPVYRFNFISTPEVAVDGFIAHEIASIVPEAITGEKDEVDEDGNPVYQGIDQSKLVPLLTAALQEALARIEALESK